MFLSWLSLGLSAFFIFMYLISELLGSPVMCSTFLGLKLCYGPPRSCCAPAFSTTAMLTSCVASWLLISHYLKNSLSHGFQYWMCHKRRNSCVQSPGVSVDYVSSKLCYSSKMSSSMFWFKWFNTNIYLCIVAGNWNSQMFGPLWAREICGATGTQIAQKGSNCDQTRTLPTKRITILDPNHNYLVLEVLVAKESRVGEVWPPPRQLQGPKGPLLTYGWNPLPLPALVLAED
jgi:hypothetical protein